jgi:hypothetical protein
MTAITAHGTPVLVETARYLAFAHGAIKPRATEVKFRLNLALAQSFAFAAVRALRSAIDVLGVVVIENCMRLAILLLTAALIALLALPYPESGKCLSWLDGQCIKTSFVK